MPRENSIMSSCKISRAPACIQIAVLEGKGCLSGDRYGSEDSMKSGTKVCRPQSRKFCGM